MHPCSCPHLLLRGLMTIGMVDYSPNPECFARLLQVLNRSKLFLFLNR